MLTEWVYALKTYILDRRDISDDLPKLDYSNILA